MRVSFSNPNLEQLFIGNQIGKPVYGEAVVKRYKQKIAILANVDSMRELSRLNSMNLEALKANRAGSYSIRIDKKYRLIFTIEPNDILIAEEIIIDELTNHYK